MHQEYKKKKKIDGSLARREIQNKQNTQSPKAKSSKVISEYNFQVPENFLQLLKSTGF